MYKKYLSGKGDFGADYKTKSGTKRCEFYNEGFRRNNNIAPEFVDIMPKYRGQIKPNSLAGRLKSGQCEMCGANPVKVYMHHVKRLKDLNADNEFDELMLLKRRKSLALCPKCYEEAKTKSHLNYERWRAVVPSRGVKHGSGGGYAKDPRTKGSMAWRFLPYELYTMQRYLQYGTLAEKNLTAF